MPIAVAIARAFSSQVNRAASAHTQLLRALDFGVGPSYEVVIAGQAGAADTTRMLRALRGRFIPNKVVLLRPNEQRRVRLAAPTRYDLTMSEYRRLDAPGATVFFTVVTERRRLIFNDPAAVDLLRAALGRVISDHPFTIEAIVIMVDHIHAIWTMPPGDDRFGLRWSAIKAAFTRAYIAAGGHETPGAMPSRSVGMCWACDHAYPRRRRVKAWHPAPQRLAKGS